MLKKIKYFITRNYKELKCDLSVWWTYSFIYNSWRFITVRLWEKLGRSLLFFKMGWNNVDWDYTALHELTLFKLKRMQYVFIHYGHHSEECENYRPKMKSLALAIKLLERYCGDDSYDYYSKPLDRHEQKWGKTENETIPSQKDDDGYVRTYEWKTIRKKAITPEEMEQERKEFLKAYSRTDERRERDIKIIYGIIAKYNRYWWD